MILETFEDFLSQSFGEGVYSRELRLSKEEAGVVLQKYPKVRIIKHAATEAQDGKCWYEVHLPILTRNVQNDIEQSPPIFKLG